jgi:hypothetical protein
VDSQQRRRPHIAGYAALDTRWFTSSRRRRRIAATAWSIVPYAVISKGRRGVALLQAAQQLAAIHGLHLRR